MGEVAELEHQGGGGGHYAWRGAAKAHQQSRQHQRQNEQAHHEVALLHQVASGRALGENIPELHQPIDGHHQQQGQPVQPYAQAAITLFRILQHLHLLPEGALHCPGPSRHARRRDPVVSTPMLQGLSDNALILTALLHRIALARSGNLLAPDG